MESLKKNALWSLGKNNNQERLEKLYGSNPHRKVVEKALRKSRRLSTILLGLLLIVTVLSICRGGGENKWLDFDASGSIRSITRPNPGEASLIVDAEVVSEDGEILAPKGVRLVVKPQSVNSETVDAPAQNNETETKDVLLHQIRKTVYEINHEENSKQVVLPDRLSDGTPVSFVPKKENYGLLLFGIFGTAISFAYQSRDREILRAERTSRESVLRALPEFVNKLVLLLNAGLVMSVAFQKIVTEHNKRTGGENDYFYSQLTQIMIKCHETNSPVHMEIRNFAIRTGVVEFMRLSNIINDSLTKGSDLMKQLQMEGGSLWMAKRKQLEEKGKIAESKLTFPLVILLLVLVLITIAPAMMEMK